MKTQYLCFPLNIKPSTTTTNTSKSSTATTNGRGPPATTLLDRFRVVVFRLIMASALSKANNKSSSSRSSKTNQHDYYCNISENNNHGQESVRRSTCYLYDPYHSEALADCIEFIKKKSASSSPSDHFTHHDEVDDVATSTRVSTVGSDIIIPLPIM